MVMPRQRVHRNASENSIFAFFKSQSIRQAATKIPEEPKKSLRATFSWRMSIVNRSQSNSAKTALYLLCLRYHSDFCRMWLPVLWNVVSGQRLQDCVGRISLFHAGCNSFWLAIRQRAWCFVEFTVAVQTERSSIRPSRPMSRGRCAASNLERTRRTGRVGHGGIRACQRHPTTPAGPNMHRFPQPVLLQNRSKNGAVSGADVPGLVPFSFPRIVTEAERQGFEPWVPVRALRFSRPVWI